MTENDNLAVMNIYSNTPLIDIGAIRRPAEGVSLQIGCSLMGKDAIRRPGRPGYLPRSGKYGKGLRPQGARGNPIPPY